MKGFPLTLTLRIDWSHMDLFGHVNNVAYFTYIQAARVNFWEHIGLTTLYAETKTGPKLASTGCQFKAQLSYPGQVIIHTRMEFIGNTSFGFHHILLNEAGEAVAEAHDVMVMYDFGKQEKTPFPESLRQKVRELALQE